MAKKTATKKLADERKKYEVAMSELGKGMQQAIVDMLAPLIPEGWYLAWEQKDDCYNDEDYYFGIEAKALNSVLKPRKGKLLKEERPSRTETKKDPYGHEYAHTVDYGSPAEYEWHLDEKCQERKSIVFYSDDDPGIISIGGDSIGDLLPEEEYAQLVDVFESIDDSDLRRAFGDSATVTINNDGSYEVQ